jgi:diketogulonate reductase-like aldo/keto reductase
VLLRWSLQKGFGAVFSFFKLNSHRFRFVPLPKSATPERIRSNAQLYDFELEPEEMEQLDGLDRGKEGSISWNPVDAP